MQKTYEGKRVAGRNNAVIVAVDLGGGTKIRNSLVHFPIHSPDGFEWGYGGSGPSDLALAIMLDYLHEAPSIEELKMGQPLATRLYQDFKWSFVSKWKADTWSLPSRDIEVWMEKDEIQRHINEHAKLWASLEDYVGHDFGLPDHRMQSSDPAFKKGK